MVAWPDLGLVSLHTLTGLFSPECQGNRESSTTCHASYQLGWVDHRITTPKRIYAKYNLALNPFGCKVNTTLYIKDQICLAYKCNQIRQVQDKIDK